MAEEEKSQEIPKHAVDTEWGKTPDDHYGYSSEEERLNKRGMDDWELVEKIPESQNRVPKWFIAIVIMVLLVAFGLTLPFWGDRPDHPRPWFTWGHLAAVVYALVAGGFIYFMVGLYGSKSGGRLDHDAEDHDDVDMPK